MTPSPFVVFEALHSSVQLPTRATARSAGYDLRAFLADRMVDVYEANNVKRQIYCTSSNPTIALQPGDRAMIPLGFKAQLPLDFEAQVRPRSGKALKVGLGIVNAPGTVDADYPNEWAVLVINHSTIPLVIDHNEAIAQMVLARFEVLPIVDGTVGVTTERVGGFGSTGN